MNMLIAYDIGHPRRLNRIAKILKDYGLRVQKSIFEVDITIAQFQQLRQRVEAEMEATEDGIKYYPLCGKCGGVWLHIGQGHVQWDEQDWRVI